MALLIISLVLMSILLMLFLQQRASVKKMQQELSKEQSKSIQLEQKIESSKDEFKKNKEELERKRNELQDLKESNKKKMRRLMESDVNNKINNEDNMNEKILDDSNKTILALENVIETLKNDHENEKHNLEANIKKEFEAKEEALNTELNKLQEEIKKLKKGAKLEGYKIDFSQLPNEVANEVVRIIKKSQQDERLNGINRAKLLLAQEKFTTLQKRYFEVCRELAVAMGNTDTTNIIATRDFAEEIISHNHVNSIEEPIDSDSLGNIKDPKEDDNF